MKKLIVDSGATNSQWVMLDQGQASEPVETSGMNLLQVSLGALDQILAKGAAAFAAPDEVYFYAAGMSFEEPKQRIETALREQFPNAKINAEGDVKAACLSVASGGPSLVGILGTGSNSCYWDGTAIKAKIPSWGYALGDLGSGATTGLAWLKKYVYGELPDKLSEKFQQAYGLDREVILDRMYQQERPSAFVASFMPFIAEHKAEPYVATFLSNQFEAWFNSHIAPIRQHSQKVSLVGSIAYYFQEDVKQVLDMFGMELASVVQSPMEGLVAYHAEN